MEVPFARYGYYLFGYYTITASIWDLNESLAICKIYPLQSAGNILIIMMCQAILIGIHLLKCRLKIIYTQIPVKFNFGLTAGQKF